MFDYNDYSILTYLRSFAGNSRMLWSLGLAEFDFEIEHLAGTKIRHADALSRHVNAVPTDQTLSKESKRSRASFVIHYSWGDEKAYLSISEMRKKSFTGKERMENTSYFFPTI
jgi:hypothetical protein